MSDVAVWTCPEGHPDWPRPTPAQLTESQDNQELWFECHQCGARWRATTAQRDMLVHSGRIRQRFGELANEAAMLHQRVHQAAHDDARAERRSVSRERAWPLRFVYECDRERRRVLARLGAAATVDDLITIIDRQIADQAWTYGLLYDLKAGNPVPLPTDQARRVAEYVGRCARTLGRRGPVAIVTRNVEALRGLLNCDLAGQRLGFDVDVFVAVPEAERWLAEQQSIRRDS